MADINITLQLKDKKKAITGIKDVDKTVDQLAKSLTVSRKATIQLSKSMAGVGSSILKATAAATAFAGAFALNRAVKEAVSLENALTGLSSVARNTGNNVGQVLDAAKELSADGLIPLSQSSAALKNLLATGLDAPKAIKVFKSLREAAAFNRQGQLSLGDAIEGASQGIKNQISNLIDNAGITKNISVLQKEYAASINTTVGRLSEQQKVLAIANGIIKEATVFQGDYVKVLGTFSGAQSEVTGRLRFFLAEVGNIITKNPIVIKGLKSIANTLKELTIEVREAAPRAREFFDNLVRGVSESADSFGLFKNIVLGTLAGIASGFAGLGIVALVNQVVAGFAAIRAAAFSGNLLTPLIAGFNLLRASIVGSTLAANILKASLTLGLSIAVGVAVTKFLQLKDEVGSAGDALRVVALKAKLAARELKLFALNKTFLGDDENIKATEESIESLKREISSVGEAYGPVTDEVLEFNKELINQGAAAKKGTVETVKAVQSLRASLSPEFIKLQKELNKSLTPETTKLKQELESRLSIIDEQVKKNKDANVLSIADFRATQRLKLAAVKDFNSKNAVLVDKAAAKAAKDRKDLLEAEKLERDEFLRLVKDPFEAIDVGNIKAAAVGFATTITKGSEGAKDILVSGISKGIDKLLPGVGEAVGPIVGAFAEGPKKVKEFVNGFLKSIPKIITNIIQSIPIFIAEFISGIGVLLDELILAMPRVIDALIASIPRLVDSLVAAGPSIIRGAILAMPQLSNSLVVAGPSIIQGAISAVPTLSVELVKTGPEIIKSMISSLGGFGQTFIDLGKKIIQGFTQIFSSDVFGKFKDFGVKIFEGFRDLISRFNPVSILSKLFKFDGGGKGVVEKFLNLDFPGVRFAQGGLVGGTPRVKGDSEKNDTVRALLSPGEAVIPRSVINGGIESTIDFVKSLGIGGLRDGRVSGGQEIQNFGFGSFFKDTFRKVVDVVKDTADAPKNILDAVLSGDPKAILNSTNFLLDQFGQFGESILPTNLRDILRSLRNIGASVNPADLISNPSEVIPNAVRSVRDTFLSPGLKGVLRPPGLQNGGTIPAGFPNDSFRANLSSGELVVPTDLTRRLDRFITENDSGKPNEMTNNLLVQVIELLAQPQSVSTSINVDGQELANAILELNRNNARIA